MNYTDAIKILTSQAKFQIKLGLERVQSILNLIDNPQNKLKIIHIAGTNGKGSVSSILANILKCSGYKTGLYTSPHLVKYTERFKINNIDISEEVFSTYIETICSIAEANNIDLTEFEILTVCALKYFYDNSVDIAIIETGLGGRFDATNTSDNTLLSIITSISLDHTDRLGNTIDKIAYEKAGIIKKNSNVIISEENLGYDVIKNYADSQNSKIIPAVQNIQTVFENKQNYIIYGDKKYEFSLLGTYQNKNLQLVLTAVEFLRNKNFSISENELTQALKTVRWPARLEYIKEKNLIIDGAHNPDAAIELKKSLDYYFPNQSRLFIYSTLNTKDYQSIARNLFNEDDKIYYIEFDHPQAVSYEEYKSIINIKGLNKLSRTDLEYLLSKNHLKIISGSLYMIGNLYKEII